MLANDAERMLRHALLWIGVLLTLAGLWLLFGLGERGGFGALAFGLLLLLAIAIERRGYDRVVDAAPGPDWQPTGERFREPGSNSRVEVFYQARTGRRLYVRLPSSPD